MISETNKEHNVWDTISNCVKDIHGWSPVEQLYSLYLLGLLTQNLEGDFVEIGAWGGRSAIALGLAAKQLNNTCVHSIDYFPNIDDWKENIDGTYSFNIKFNGNIIDGHKQQTVWKEPFENSILPFYKKHPHLLDYFIKNIQECGLKNIVKPFKGNSEIFIKSLPNDFKCKLVYIDGEHSSQAVKTDIVSLKNHIVENGIICFDDAFSGYLGVDEAIEKLVINSGEFYSFVKLTRKLFIAFKK